MMPKLFSVSENLLLKIVCLYLVLYCTSPSLVQGLPVNSKYKDRQSRSRVPKSTDLHRVYIRPTITMRGQLHSRTGYFLEILQNGTINATVNNSSIYTIIEIQSYNKTLKRFLGVHTGYYLAYEIRSKRKGKFIGLKKLGNDSLFREHMEENSYITYKPMIYPREFNDTGFLAIKDNGKFRRVERSKPGMHAAQFTFLPLEQQ